jgi:hypothetical protein
MINLNPLIERLSNYKKKYRNQKLIPKLYNYWSQSKNYNYINMKTTLKRYLKDEVINFIIFLFSYLYRVNSYVSLATEVKQDLSNHVDIKWLNKKWSNRSKKLGSQ